MVPRASKQKNTDATAYTPWPGASVTTLDFSESSCQDRAIFFRAFFLMHYIGLCIRISNVDGTTRVQTIKTRCYGIHTLARGKRYHTGLFRKLLPGPRNSDRKSTRLNSSHVALSRMRSSA